MVGGPTIAFFTIGIYFPFISEIPALVGLVCGLLVSGWVFIGSNQFPPGPNWTRPLYMNTTACADDIDQPTEYTPIQAFQANQECFLKLL